MADTQNPVIVPPGGGTGSASTTQRIPRLNLNWLSNNWTLRALALVAAIVLFFAVRHCATNLAAKTPVGKKPVATAPAAKLPAESPKSDVTAAQLSAWLAKDFVPNFNEMVKVQRAQTEELKKLAAENAALKKEVTALRNARSPNGIDPGMVKRAYYGVIFLTIFVILFLIYKGAAFVREARHAQPPSDPPPTP